MRNHRDVFLDEQVYPASVSASGTNAYFHRCEEVQHSAAYASCLDLIEQRKKGALSSMYSECSVAIGKGTCPAIGMRKQEVEKDRAMFFISRNKMRAFYDQTDEAVYTERPAMARVSVVAKKRVEPAKVFTLINNGFVDAINSALSKLTASQSPAIIGQSPVSLAGLSPMAIARFRAQGAQQ